MKINLMKSTWTTWYEHKRAWIRRVRKRTHVGESDMYAYGMCSLHLNERRILTQLGGNNGVFELRAVLYACIVPVNGLSHMECPYWISLCVPLPLTASSRHYFAIFHAGSRTRWGWGGKMWWNMDLNHKIQCVRVQTGQQKAKSIRDIFDDYFREYREQFATSYESAGIFMEIPRISRSAKKPRENWTCVVLIWAPPFHCSTMTEFINCRHQFVLHAQTSPISTHSDARQLGLHFPHGVRRMHVTFYSHFPWQLKQNKTTSMHRQWPNDRRRGDTFNEENQIDNCVVVSGRGR